MFISTNYTSYSSLAKDIELYGKLMFDSMVSISGDKGRDADKLNKIRLEVLTQEYSTIENLGFNTDDQNRTSVSEERSKNSEIIADIFYSSLYSGIEVMNNNWGTIIITDTFYSTDFWSITTIASEVIEPITLSDTFYSDIFESVSTTTPEVIEPIIISDTFYSDIFKFILATSAIEKSVVSDNFYSMVYETIESVANGVEEYSTEYEYAHEYIEESEDEEIYESEDEEIYESEDEEIYESEDEEVIVIADTFYSQIFVDGLNVVLNADEYRVQGEDTEYEDTEYEDIEFEEQHEDTEFEEQHEVAAEPEVRETEHPTKRKQTGVSEMNVHSEPESDDVDLSFFTAPVVETQSKPNKKSKNKKKEDKNKSKAKKQVKSQAESNLAYGQKDDEPTDIRVFIKKHPDCDLTILKQYFTQKEIQNAILVGKVIKKGNKFFV